MRLLMHFIEACSFGREANIFWIALQPSTQNSQTSPACNGARKVSFTLIN